ncbi:DUF3305 domain-containing protein [Aestuariibius sp. 2305UL40-4]|uniref:DUF3305 domain-containing protein n=1 Tax=Aestuariibius violaceus TaxID=3234132 RepID=UPI00398F4DB2
MRRLPGVTRWAKWSWRAVAVLPGAAPSDWKVLRKDGDAVEFHAATVPMELYRTDTEAYLHELQAESPSIYVVMRQGTAERPEILLATASPYEGQDYCDSGEELVERVPMPSALRAMVERFVAEHHEEEEFVKRKRDKKRIDREVDGVGDARISQMTDVYRAPGRKVRVS